MATTQAQHTQHAQLNDGDPLDRIVEGLDALLKVLTLPAKAQRASPADDLAPDSLSDDDKRLAGNLMRVNHAGEIAAQGLYLGQALVARKQSVKQQFTDAAAEETDHLAWCDSRLRELDSRPSVFTPLWLIGSFAIGVGVGVVGDATSLGFVEETEHQVKAHLESHDLQLPQNDHRSRAILAQMQADELRHAEQARAEGGTDLPTFAPPLMRAAAKVMTTLAART